MPDKTDTPETPSKKAAEPTPEEKAAAGDELTDDDVRRLEHPEEYQK